MTPSKKPATAVLLWGEDDFLLREAAAEVAGTMSATQIDAVDWRGGELHDLATPSLLGERRALIVNDAKNLPAEALPEISEYLAFADPDSVLVLSARVGERAKVPATLNKIVEPAGEVRKVEAPARKDLEAWTVRRARAGEQEVSAPAARALVAVIGESPAELARALEQLASAFPGERITPELVHRQFRGLGEQRTWDLCDKAFGRDLPGAIRSLRSIEEGGDDALMVLGGIASRLRDLISVRALPEPMSPSDVAREAGLRFEWQARRYLQQARGYTMERLVELHALVADSDRALKSGSEAGVVMPVLISAIASGQ